MILSCRFPEEKLLGICQGPLGWLPSTGIFWSLVYFHSLYFRSFISFHGSTGLGVCFMAVKC